MFKSFVEVFMERIRLTKSKRRAADYLADDSAAPEGGPSSYATSYDSKGKELQVCAEQRAPLKPAEIHPYQFLVRETLEHGLKYESFEVDTRDHEDHTFCGIMFDLRCKRLLPLEYLEIQSVWIRGGLGHISIWHTADTFKGKHEEPEMWTQVYKGKHDESFANLVQINLETPIRVDSGNGCGIYVHSALRGDQGIVYDNQKESKVTYDDNIIQLRPGLAHLSNKPFHSVGPWGQRGIAAWRYRREFVGRLSYGCRYLKWNPEVHLRFPERFQEAAMALICGARRPESPLYDLEEPLIFYILNKCGWDWFGRAPSESALKNEEDAVAYCGQDLFEHGITWSQYDDFMYH